MPQDYDWNKHHAILYDLMNYRWPVVYKNNAMLTYYIGQYVIPATLGKLLGKSEFVVNWLMMLWNSIGVFLVFVFLCQYFEAKKTSKKIAILLIMFLWGGAINLGSFFYAFPTKGLAIDSFFGAQSFKWLDIDYIRVHFASNFDALMGAFQHVIPVWISCCLLLNDKLNIRNYVIISLPLLFSSTFGFIYFSVILIILTIYKFFKYSKMNTIKELFSLPNLLLLPLTGLVIVYLSGNFLSDKPGEFGFGFINMFEHIWFYAIFCLVEFLGYFFFLFKSNKKNIIFYIVLFELLVIPFITMGVWNDLCSRGSIPARFVLMVMCMELLLNKKKTYIRKIGVSVIIGFSAINIFFQSMNIIDRAFKGWNDKSFLQDNYGSYEGYAANPTVREDDAYNYYTLNYDESFFSKIAK